MHTVYYVCICKCIRCITCHAFTHTNTHTHIKSIHTHTHTHALNVFYYLPNVFDSLLVDSIYFEFLLRSSAFFFKNKKKKASRIYVFLIEKNTHTWFNKLQKAANDCRYNQARHNTTLTHTRLYMCVCVCVCVCVNAYGSLFASVNFESQIQSSHRQDFLLQGGEDP